MQYWMVKCAHKDTKGRIMQHISDNIKRIRNEAGLSQQELADRAGISKSQIWRLEKGEQKNPTLETLIPISTALGVSLDEIVFGEESKNATYLSKAIEELEPEDRKTIRKIIRGWILMSHNEKIFEE
ncbi:helix-turn-helix domain-containing protein [Aeromonas veronii]|uniref:helix-turn-helix domain-containing protein n=1 Tax=Aeromonas veronii TaxID=654 RepID=UPI003D216ABB